MTNDDVKDLVEEVYNLFNGVAKEITENQRQLSPLAVDAQLRVNKLWEVNLKHWVETKCGCKITATYQE